MIELNKIYNECCLQGMWRIPDKSVDMILCDLPYGTTACKWDTIIPFEPLWEQYERVIKDNGAIVLTGSQPFTSSLIMSNPKLFKYCWVWEKTMPTGGIHAKNKPLKIHEDIAVFSLGTTVHASQSKNRMPYFPQMEEGKPYKTLRKKGTLKSLSQIAHRNSHVDYLKVNNGERYPKSIIKAANPKNNSLHPTQKPITIFEYLIKTYTNESETVLDNCMGSGTTAIAAINTKRNFIGFEKDETYYKLSIERIEKHKRQKAGETLELFG